MYPHTDSKRVLGSGSHLLLNHRYECCRPTADVVRRRAGECLLRGGEPPLQLAIVRKRDGEVQVREVISRKNLERRDERGLHVTQRLTKLLEDRSIINVGAGERRRQRSSYLWGRGAAVSTCMQGRSTQRQSTAIRPRTSAACEPVALAAQSCAPNSRISRNLASISRNLASIAFGLWSWPRRI